MKCMTEVIARFYLLISFLLLSIITLLSLWPVAQLPAVPGTDKTHHFIAYGALILPVAIKQHKQLWYFVLGFALYSGLIELIQPYVNRYGEWLDLAANSLGLLCGLALAKLWLFCAGQSRK